jgi:uncharacterized protein
MNRDLAPDVLRGFALLGILLVNIPFMAHASEEGVRGEWVSGGANSIATFLMIGLFQGKFYLLFSFLYGYSSQYIVKSEKRNRRRWAKRCLVLMLIGAVHFTFLWHGDILFAYGFLGMFLIPFLFRSDRTLKIWSIVLYSFFVLLLMAVATLTIVAEQIDPSQFVITESRMDQLMLRGSYFESLAPRANLWALGFFGSGLLLQGGFAFVAFLLGIKAAKNHALQLDSNYFRPKRLIKIGFLIGLPIQLALAGIYVWNELQAEPSEALYLATILLSFIAAPLLSAGYIGAVLQILRSKPSIIERIKYVGKMSLTTYLMQSLIMTLLFGNWGLGMFQKLDFWLVFLIGIVIWLFQVRLAEYWITKYQQGPLERLMAKLTSAKPPRLSA